MAPDAPLWQIALVSTVSVMLGQWLAKKRGGDPSKRIGYRLGLWIAGLGQYRRQRG